MAGRRCGHGAEGPRRRRRAAQPDGPRRRRAREPIGDRHEAAMELAFAQLAARPRSEAEVRRRLQRAGATPAAVDRAIARLLELRYLDDAAFAIGRAADLARRGYGPRAIEARLAAAGVRGAPASDGAARAVGDEVALARAALERRLRGRAFAALERAEQARLLRWLVGRGFSPGAARAACGAAGRFDPDPDEV